MASLIELFRIKSKAATFANGQSDNLDNMSRELVTVRNLALLFTVGCTSSNSARDSSREDSVVNQLKRSDIISQVREELRDFVQDVAAMDGTDRWTPKRAGKMDTIFNAVRRFEMLVMD